MQRQHTGVWRALLGFLLLCWIAFLSAVAITIARSIGVTAAPRLLNLVPRVLDRVHKQVFLAQVGFWLGLLILLTLVALLTYHAWRESERRGNQKDAEFVEGFVEGMRNVLEEILPQVTGRGSSADESLPETQKQEPLPIAAGSRPQGNDPDVFIYPSQLPRPVPFIGRGDLISRMKGALLAGSTLNICAVEGRAGIGKTALAAEVVGELLDDDQQAEIETRPRQFPGGAAWISCENLVGTDGLNEFWEKVVNELRLEGITDIGEPGKRLRAIKDALWQRPRTLIVLDNIEPNLGGLDRIRTAEQIVNQLYVPDHIVLLMTARHEIDLPGRVQPVPLSALDVPTSRKLFLEVLQVADSGHVRPNEDDLSAIGDIITYAEGLPILIINLASFAGRRQVTLPQLYAQLRTDGPPPSVEQKVRSSIALSWKVLTKSQQRLFAGLSLMANLTFPAGTAEAIARAAIMSENSVDAPDGDPEGDLETLIGYYLLEALPTTAGYRLHRDLREYGAERFKGISKEERFTLGEAVVTYWLEVGKRRPRWKQMDLRQRKNFVNAQLRRVTEKKEWIDKVFGNMGQ